jgi:hypothetical protein
MMCRELGKVNMNNGEQLAMSHGDVQNDIRMDTPRMGGRDLKVLRGKPCN